MGVIIIREMVGTSPRSWSDAARQAVATASKTVRNIQTVEVVKSRPLSRTARSSSTASSSRSASNTRGDVAVSLAVASGRRWPRWPLRSALTH